MSQNTGTDTMEKANSEQSGSKPSRVIAVKQHTFERTELYHSVHVVGPEDGPGFAQMFARAKCKKSKKGIEDADFVIFTGGAVDVHPTLYGIDPNDTHDTVYFENQACVDTMMEYIKVWQECAYRGKPMVGVCLGAQFLHVMNGGKLYQDIDNHNSDHVLYCERTGKTIRDSSSVHHQACIRNDKMNVIGTAYESNERWLNRTDCELVIDDPNLDDIEAFWYEETCSLGFQGHPEYQGYPEYTEWCMQQIEHYIINNHQLAYVNNALCMKQEYLQNRKYKLPEAVHQFIKENR